MAGYRNISVSFWTDSKVDDDFTPEDKYFYLYLMTNPNTSLCGCYEISMKQMERETGYNADTVNRLLQRMEEMHGVIQYSAKTKEVLILNWWKYNWSSSAKVKNAIVSVADHIKHEPFRRYVMHRVSIRYGCPMHTTDTDTVSESDTDTETDTVTETESETENRVCADKPQKTKRFTPPTVEEVRAYCKERGNSVDAEKFVAYYTANGWKVGRNAMKDWRAAVITWERKDGKKKPEPENSSIDMNIVDRIMNPYGA